MKTFGAIMLFALILVFAGVVFVVMNRPANLLIRKTFSTLTGLELVNTKAYDQIKSDNIILEQTQQKRQQIIDSIQNVNSKLHKKLAIKELRNDSLQARLELISSELSQAKELFQTMDITDRLIEFDQLTEGSKPTFLSDYQGHEVAIAEPSRISDATWKIHEGNAAKVTGQLQAERIDNISDQLTIVKSINANLEDAIEREKEQRNDEIKKRENCEKAESDTLKKAKGIAGGGIVSFIIAVAILIL